MSEATTDLRPPPYDNVPVRDRVGVAILNFLSHLLLSRGYRARVAFFTMRGIEAQNALENRTSKTSTATKVKPQPKYFGQ